MGIPFPGQKKAYFHFLSTIPYSQPCWILIVSPSARHCTSEWFRLKNQDLDLKISWISVFQSNTDFVADHTNWKSMSGRISVSEICNKIIFSDFVLDWKSEDRDFKI